MEDSDGPTTAACRFEDGRCATHEVRLKHHHDPMTGAGDAYCPTVRERESKNLPVVRAGGYGI